MAEQRTAIWRVIGASVRGARHVPLNWPNQDAGAWWPVETAGPPLMAAVADGHGSATFFRCERGSRFAVETAIELLRELAAAGPEAIERWAATDPGGEHLARRIVARWVERARADAAADPPVPEQMARLRFDHDPQLTAYAASHPELPYGATLLAAAITETSLLCLQIGDGDIVLVSDDGAVTRPMPDDPRMVGRVPPSSLYMPGAWRYLRFHVMDLAAPPALVLLASDGFSDSYANESDFFAACAELLRSVRADGLEAVNNWLSDHLEHLTATASGDDITLALLCRMAVV